MKIRLKLLISTGILVPAFVFAPVAAVTNDSDTAQTADPQSQTTLAQEDSADDIAARKDRLEKRKTELKTRLDAAKLARVKKLCKASQGNLSSISGRIKGLETSRSHVYANLVDRLTKLSGLIKDKGVDTAELDAQITQISTLIEAFNTDLAAYKLAVSDLAAMDCAADPTAFQASLEAARAARAKTADDAAAIRTYLSDTIKPTLKELRAQVENETENGGTQ